MIMQAVMDGEAKNARQIVTISSSDGKVSSPCKPGSIKSKDLDLSTAESGSDVDDGFSPQSSMVCRNPKLTPVREEGKISSSGISVYDDTPKLFGVDSIPVVDKAIDNGWGGKTTVRKLDLAKGGIKVSDLLLPFSKVFYGIMAIIIAIFLGITSTARHIFRACNCSGKHTTTKERKPFIKPVHYTEMPGLADLEPHYAFYPSVYLDASPAVRKRLDRLEEKVTLLCKTQETHAPKESLRDASLVRIRSLEAELAETRKTLRAVLEKQTDLFNCLEHTKEQNWKRKASCW